jgi:hypothetical protein
MPTHSISLECRSSSSYTLLNGAPADLAAHLETLRLRRD